MDRYDFVNNFGISYIILNGNIIDEYIIRQEAADGIRLQFKNEIEAGIYFKLYKEYDLPNTKRSHFLKALEEQYPDVFPISVIAIVKSNSTKEQNNG